jgi:AAA family ATP:ADP antiporter
MSRAPGEKKNFLDRFLGLFGEVRAGESWTAVLLMSNLFFLLTGYLIIKTVREPLILAGGGAEIKSYAAAGQALLLFLIVPAYGFLASKINRIKLITWVTLFFISNLIVFYVLARWGVAIGVVFFLWVGIFNLFVVAQFWSFANDLYTQEQGKRLFGIVAFGGSIGAIVGPKVAGWLLQPLGVFELLLVAGVILGICILITNIVHARESDQAAEKKDHAEKPLGKEGGFKLVVTQRYLFLIALLIIVLNLVNTTGEYILGKIVTQEARQKVVDAERQAAASGATTLLSEGERKRIEQKFIGNFYGNFYFWVSLLSAGIQLLIVSRILKSMGAAALLFLPFIALGGYFLIASFPVLSYIRSAKILENAVNYSLQNTTHQTLFLPTSRETKYKAKAAIDTFFVRAGDVASAMFVFLGAQLALSVSTFASINIVMAAVWIFLAIGIVRQYKTLSLARSLARSEAAKG